MQEGNGEEALSSIVENVRQEISAKLDGDDAIAPIHVSGIRLGSLIIWRNDKKFEDEDLILVEIASTVVGIQLLNFQREEDEKNLLYSQSKLKP